MDGAAVRIRISTVFPFPSKSGVRYDGCPHTQDLSPISFQSRATQSSLCLPQDCIWLSVGVIPSAPSFFPAEQFNSHPTTSDLHQLCQPALLLPPRLAVNTWKAQRSLGHCPRPRISLVITCLQDQQPLESQIRYGKRVKSSESVYCDLKGRTQQQVSQWGLWMEWPQDLDSSYKRQSLART